jgi:hypothetical protein
MVMWTVVIAITACLTEATRRRIRPPGLAALVIGGGVSSGLWLGVFLMEGHAHPLALVGWVFVTAVTGGAAGAIRVILVAACEAHGR